MIDESTAQAIIGAGFAVGVIIWMWSMSLFRRMRSAQHFRSTTTLIRDHTPDDVLKLIVAQAHRATALERPDPNTLSASTMGVEVRFEAWPEGSGTRLTTEVDSTRYARNFSIGMGLLQLVIAPIVLVGTASLLWNYVAPNPNPAIRWQCVQICQIVHVLWPPFLIYYIYRRTLGMINSAITRLLLMLESPQ